MTYTPNERLLCLTIYITFLHLISVNYLIGQCNLSFQSTRIYTFEESCGAINFQSIIDNGIVASANCGDINFTPPFIDNNTSSISKINEKSYAVRVYPNPTLSELNLEVSNPKDVERIQIFNSVGQQIEYLAESEILNQIKLKTDEWDAGIYLIVTELKNRITHTQSVVKIY